MERGGERLSCTALTSINARNRIGYMIKQSLGLNYSQTSSNRVAFLANKRTNGSGDDIADFSVTIETSVKVFYGADGSVITTLGVPLPDNWAKVRIQRLSHRNNAYVNLDKIGSVKNYHTAMGDYGTIINQVQDGSTRIVTYYQQQTLDFQIPDNRIDNHNFYAVARLYDSSNNDISLGGGTRLRINNIKSTEDTLDVSPYYTPVQNTELGGEYAFWSIEGVHKALVSRKRFAPMNVRTGKGNVLETHFVVSYFTGLDKNKGRIQLIYKDKNDNIAGLLTYGLVVVEASTTTLYSSGFTTYYMHRVSLEPDIDLMIGNLSEAYIKFTSRVYGAVLTLSSIPHQFSSPTDISAIPKQLSTDILDSAAPLSNHLLKLMIDAYNCPSNDFRYSLSFDMDMVLVDTAHVNVVRETGLLGGVNYNIVDIDIDTYSSTDSWGLVQDSPLLVGWNVQYKPPQS